jgi:hypothetical protein
MGCSYYVAKCQKIKARLCHIYFSMTMVLLVKKMQQGYDTLSTRDLVVN